MKIHIMIRKISLEGITALFIVLWIYTGISKIGEQFNFMYQLKKQPLFSPVALELSYAVPIIELLVAVLLVWRKARIWGLWSSFVLMISFTSYVAIVLAFSKELPCQCGGIISTLNWNQHLVLNIILTILSVVGIYLFRSLRRKDSVLKMA